MLPVGGELAQWIPGNMRTWEHCWAVNPTWLRQGGAGLGAVWGSVCGDAALWLHFSFCISIPPPPTSRTRAWPAVPTLHWRETAFLSLRRINPFSFPTAPSVKPSGLPRHPRITCHHPQQVFSPSPAHGLPSPNLSSTSRRTFGIGFFHLLSTCPSTWTPPPLRPFLPSSGLEESRGISRGVSGAAKGGGQPRRAGSLPSRRWGERMRRKGNPPYTVGGNAN